MLEVISHETKDPMTDPLAAFRSCDSPDSVWQFGTVGGMLDSKNRNFTDSTKLAAALRVFSRKQKFLTLAFLGSIG